MKKIDKKFWDYHNRIKSSLKEKDLIWFKSIQIAVQNNLLVNCLNSDNLRVYRQFIQVYCRAFV
jgi:hypothetical protein